MSADILKTSIAECYVENGILYTTFMVEELLLDDLIAHTTAVRTHYADVLPLPALVYIGKLRAATKEVRDYSAKEGSEGIVIATAIIQTSMLMRIGTNLFMTFSKPKHPVKAFADEVSALKWLEQYKK
jgi:hypothetical protein